MQLRGSNMKFEPARHSSALGESHDSRVMSMKFLCRITRPGWCARAMCQLAEEFGKGTWMPHLQIFWRRFCARPIDLRPTNLEPRESNGHRRQVESAGFSLSRARN